MKRTYLIFLIMGITAAVMSIPSAKANASVAEAMYAGDPGLHVALNGEPVWMERYPIISDGRMLVSVRDVFAPMGIRLDWMHNTREMSFTGVRSDTGKTVKLVMKADSKTAVLNSIPLVSDAAPRLVDKTLMVPVRFVSELFGLDIGWDADSKTALLMGMTASQDSRGANRSFLVVIDPGHGGYEPGAVCNGVYEKDLNLDIARRLRELLVKENVNVKMTRDSDVSVGLYKRAEYANDAGADLFVSIHNNAGYSKYRGTMTLYYPSVSNTYGRQAASAVQSKMTAIPGLSDLGIIPRPNLVVLRETKMPAIITEVAFLTNQHDLGLLLTESFRQNAAVALKESILDIMDRILPHR